MEIKTKFDNCGNCKTYCEQHYGVENYTSGLNLENYLRYKDLYVYVCPTCGNISVDISNQEDANIYNKLKNNETFQEILDYSYLDGYDLQIFESHTRSVPANVFEAYAMIQKEKKNSEMYLRALNKSIELKEMIIKKYEFTVREDGDEEEDLDILETFTEYMNDSIINNAEEFVSYFQNEQINNEFLYIELIENLVRLGKIKKAKEYYEWLKNNVKLEIDLIEFIENLFKEKN